MQLVGLGNTWISTDFVQSLPDTTVVATLYFYIGFCVCCCTLKSTSSLISCCFLGQRHYRGMENLLVGDLIDEITGSPCHKSLTQCATPITKSNILLQNSLYHHQTSTIGASNSTAQTDLCTMIGENGSQLQMNRLSLRNNQLKFKTAGKLPIILEEFIEYTPI